MAVTPKTRASAASQRQAEVVQANLTAAQRTAKALLEAPDPTYAIGHFLGELQEQLQAQGRRLDHIDAVLNERK